MNKINYLFMFVLLGIVVLFSLGNTLQYYFYVDDYAFLYYLGNNYRFPWPYNSVLPLFRPVYNLFGINAFPYFALALFTYFLATIAVYFFAKHLTHNKLIAYLSSLIFATGYIGLEQFSMIAVSIINNLNVINVSITLILLIYWVETKKLRYYFLTLFMFWFSIALFPYRAYLLILFLPTLEFIKSFKLNNLKGIFRQLVFFVLRYIPFVAISVWYGIFSYGSYGSGGESNLYFSSNSKLFDLLNFVFFRELFAVLGRLILVEPTFVIFGFAPDQGLFALTGFIFFLIILLTSVFLFFGKNPGYGRNLLIVLFLTIEGYIGNMILNIDFDSNGPINRYLTISFSSFSVILPLFLFILIEKIKFKWINKKWTIVITIGLVVLSLASLARKYENGVLEDRSKPAKTFFRQLKTYIPTLSDSTYNVFYFDRASYYPIPSRFGNVLLSGAMGNSVNLAVPYNISIDSVDVVDTFEGFMRFVIYPPSGKKTSYYAFYNDEKGLHNTTEKIFTLLENGSHTQVSKDQVSYIQNQGSSSINIETNNVSSLTPLKVNLSLKAFPLNPRAFTFPYRGTQDGSGRAAYQDIQKDEIFKYLLSREKYYRTVKVDVESIHIAKKNLASHLVDDNPDTSWLSDQARWEVKIKPWIKIDLSEERNVGRILLRQLPNRKIREFTIAWSKDGNTWTKIKNIKQSNVFQDEYLVINDFERVNTRYILLTINSLAASFSPAPGLAEIEVIESDFSDMDLESAINVKNSPFEYIKNEEELLKTYEYLRQNAKLKIKAFTNKDDPISDIVLQELPIFLDRQFHEYQFQLPPGGTELRKIELDANFPANFFVESVVLENKLQSELGQEVKKKCQEFMGVDDWVNPFDCREQPSTKFIISGN